MFRVQGLRSRVEGFQGLKFKVEPCDRPCSKRREIQQFRVA